MDAACCCDTTQADAHEADFGSFLFCSCDSLQWSIAPGATLKATVILRLQLPANSIQQRAAGMQFCPRNRPVFARAGGKLSPQHVPATCALVCADLKGTYIQDLC